MNNLFQIAPWNTLRIFKEFAAKADKNFPIPQVNDKIAQHTSDYELYVRQLWQRAKENPTKTNILEFIEAMVTASEDTWRELFLDVLDLEELLPHHEQTLKKEVDQHIWYLQNSLYPDLLKEVGKGTDAFNRFDYRVVFMYSGALWSSGMLATVMFDGLEFRDLADLFLFSGPNDSETCTGPRGCDQHVGKIYTVAEILSQNIIPGKLQCYTNCRHMLIPIASPLNAEKHMSGKHNQKSHGRKDGHFDEAKFRSRVISVAKQLNIDMSNISIVFVDTYEGYENADPAEIPYGRCYVNADGTFTVTFRKDFVEDVRRSGNEVLGRGTRTTLGLGFDGLATHELTHAVDGGFAKKYSNSPELIKLWDDYRDKYLIDGNFDDIISKYAGSTPSEFLAEAAAVYITDPKWLQDHNPDVHKYLQNLYASSDIALKHMAGKHSQASHNPHKGSSSSGRVFNGEPIPWSGEKLTKLEVGAIGEQLAMRILSEQLGHPFSTLNEGVNNAPIDVAGDHVAVEVKTGLASNGKTAQHWRATIGQPGKAESELIAQMTNEEKRAHNQMKYDAILERKAAMLAEMSAMAGSEVKGMTVGIILHPDGKKADVYQFDGFHLRIPWNKAEEVGTFMGSYDV